MRKGAGTTVLCLSAFLFSQFYLSKAVFIYVVRSPHFIPSPCFIPSPLSVVRSPQSMFYTDQTNVGTVLDH